MHKIQDIQQLRGIAVILTVMAHMPLTTAIFVFNGLISPYWIGVPLFFVISGYVILSSISKYEFTTSAFYIRRIFRIFPILIVSIGLAFLLRYLTGDTYRFGTWDNLAGVSASLMGMFYNFYIIGWPVNFAPFSNIPAFEGLWSISTEEQFYLLFPALIMLGTRWRRIAVLAICFVLLAVVFRVALVILGPGNNPRLPALINAMMFRYDLIIAGLLLYLIPIRIPASSFLVWGGIGLAAAWAMLPSGPITDTVGYWLFCAGLVTTVGAASNGANVVAPGRAGRILAFFGERSYVLYVMHFHMIALGGYFLQPLNLSFAVGWTSLALTLVPGMVVVELLHRYIEKPCIRLGYRVSDMVGGQRVPVPLPSKP